MFSFFRRLGLDLVPRVDGEMVDPDAVSVVELHRVVSFVNLLLISHPRRGRYMVLLAFNFFFFFRHDFVRAISLEPSLVETPN